MHLLAQASPGLVIVTPSQTPAATSTFANPLAAVGFIWTFGILWLLIMLMVVIILGVLSIWIWRMASHT